MEFISRLNFSKQNRIFQTTTPVIYYAYYRIDKHDITINLLTRGNDDNLHIILPSQRCVGVVNNYIHTKTC